MVILDNIKFTIECGIYEAKTNDYNNQITHMKRLTSFAIIHRTKVQNENYIVAIQADLSFWNEILVQ